MPEKQELRLNKDEFVEFRTLIDNIELRDVITVKQAFEANRKQKVTGSVQVNIESAPAEINVEDQLTVLKSYRIVVKQGKKNVLVFSATYEVSFDAKNAEKVNSILEKENIRQFFEGLQLSKILWPFIREEFRTASSKAGMKPFTLPFMK